MARSPDPAASENFEPPGRFASKHRAILDAAERLFLDNGYLGTNMEELAAIARVSKPTIYTHFGGKESLFVELVSSMTTAAGDKVHSRADEAAQNGDVERYLSDYAERLLGVILTPRLLQLRRLVIGEVSRFPELARALYVNGPQRAIASLAAVFEQLHSRGLLQIDDPFTAATQFNWLVMGAPMNEAMLLGDMAVPSPAVLRRHAQASARVFVAAYGALRQSTMFSDP